MCHYENHEEHAMNSPTTPLRLIAIAGLSLSTMSLLVGCSETDSGTPAAQHDDHDDHAGHDHGDDDHAGHDHSQDEPKGSLDIYPDILGEITSLPIAGNPNTDLKIRHVQIPNFKTKDGTINVTADGISGMRSMTMPFPIGEGVSLDGFAVGDKIKFTFAVDWSGQGKNAWEITKIEKLPADTAIDYTNKIEELKDAAQDVIDDAMGNIPGNDGP